MVRVRRRSCSVTSSGFSLQELLQLLPSMHIVNHRDDLLARYQSEMEYEAELLFGRDK